MRKIITFISISLFFLLLSKPGYAQTSLKKENDSVATSGGKGKFRVKWRTNPFDNFVFIQNNGQFDGKIGSSEKVLYGVQFGMVTIYFTANKVIYRYDRNYFKKSTSADADPDADMDNLRHETRFLKTEWVDASKSVSIIAKGEKTNYYTYSVGKKPIRANIFKQIIYKNLYPGIDVVYQFQDGKDGIEYSLIVHPGADLSNVKLKYSGAKNISKNAAGDLIITGQLDIVTEHAPVTSYLGEQGNLPFATVIDGTTESFKADATYDKTKIVVIDPWITDPLFTPADWDKAYDVDWDYYGNVYAYGGQATGVLQFVKMNSAGAIQWTYNANSISGFCYGDFCTDKVTGTSYLCQGFYGGQVVKVNTLGTYIATSPGNPQFDELWRAGYDACNGDIIMAGGGTGGTNQAGVLDTTMDSLSAVDIMGVGTSLHDCSLLTVDPDGAYCYIASAQSQGYPSVCNNMIMQVALPSLAPTLYRSHEDCHFTEVLSVPYCGTGGGNYATNAMNGAAASPNWLYLYNGDTLRRYHKSTGLLTTQCSIRTNSPFRYGGLDVDPCDNIYLGVDDSIYVLDSTYAIQAKVPLQDTVFDLHVGQRGALYACGRGYVTQLVNPVVPSLISSSSGTPSSCSSCNGTATVNVNCGISPFQFHWSDGSTNQTDTGLCPGVYTVVAVDAACPPNRDTAVINVAGENGFSAFITDTNPDCGLKKGNATIHVTGGVPPYVYNWSNGSTNQTDTGLVAGTYICRVTDHSGCIFDIGITLVNPIVPKMVVTPVLDSICIGMSIPILAAGEVKTYKWTPSAGLSCDTCPNVTATPTITTTYSITGSDSIGCTNTITSTIKVLPIPKPIIHGKDSVCSGYTDTLSATGGGTYRWSTGDSVSSIKYHAVNTQTITVTASNGICTHDTSLVIHVFSAAASITASADSVCQGDSILLTGSGGITYKWSTGNTSTGIWISPPTTKTYTLYTYAGSCRDSATKLIKVIPGITATITAAPDTVCPHQTTTLHVTGLTGQINGYRWNTGATTTSITVNDTVTTTYTATLYGVCDSVQKLMQVVVIPLPKPVFTGINWKCNGQQDTLSVSSSINPATYRWYNGSTDTFIITGPINADSIVGVTVSNSLGCSVTVIDTILLRQPPNAKANPPAIFCAGQPITLTASATGTFPPFNYTWSTGQTGTSITINPGPDSATTYTVSVSNGCAGTAATTAIPNFPILSACCDQTLFIEHDSANRHDTAILVAVGNSIKYQWSEQPDNGTITCIDPPLCDSVRVITDVSTTYTVLGTDSNGCQTEQLLLVTIDIPCFDLTIPNVFTPSNPGILGVDNMFYIRTQNISAWDITIFDRWGKEMYHSTDAYQYWNGNTEGGSKASAGVYYYIINATCQNTTYKKDGFVQLIR